MKKKPREQLTIKIGAVILVIILYLAFFLFPALDSIKAKQSQIEGSRRDLASLKKLLEENPRPPEDEKTKFEGSLNSFVEQKAREIDFTIAYVRPYGERGEGVEIKVDEMQSPKLVSFLYQLKTSGIKVSRLNMRDYQGTGNWVVSMHLDI